MADKKQVSSGVGMFGVVFLVLLTLKVVGVAPVGAWSWWWVTAPLWAPVGVAFGVVIALFGGALLLALAAAPFKALERRRAMRAVVEADE